MVFKNYNTFLNIQQKVIYSRKLVFKCKYLFRFFEMSSFSMVALITTFHFMFQAVNSEKTNKGTVPMSKYSDSKPKITVIIIVSSVKI